ncbi:MAG: ribosome maturation factor RimM [Rhodospirillaceae bacterium]|nr:ribosome maturation factor RimM [Rhodospirillaceae bacterium]
MLGTIGAPRGIKGDIRIKSFTEDPRDLAAYGSLWSADGSREFTIKVVGEAKGQVIARIKGVADRNAAEALKGTDLYVSRDVLPPPEEDAFYHVDLIGLRVETTEGAFLGEVRAVFDHGAGDVLDIGGGPHKGLMVPFTRDAVPEVDLAGGKMIVDPPEGLLEPPDEEAKREEA